MQSTSIPVPLPEVTDATEPFWDGCQEDEFRVQRCSSCGTLRFYPRPMCAECSSLEFEWIATSGKGKVVTWTVIHHVFSPAFADKVPYAVVIVELDDGGVRIPSNLVDCPPEEIHEGMPVEAVFVDVGSMKLPYFRRR